jgi:hypothetical protein
MFYWYVNECITSKIPPVTKSTITMIHKGFLMGEAMTNSVINGDKNTKKAHEYKKHREDKARTCISNTIVILRNNFK